MHTSKAAAAAVLVTAGVLSSACGSKQATKTAATASPSASASASPSAQATAGQGPSTAPSRHPSGQPAGAPACSFDYDKIDVRLYDSNPTRTTEEHPLIFEMRGNRTCSLNGTPTLWLLDDSGRRMHKRSTPGALTPGMMVRSGQFAYAQITVATNGPRNPDKPAKLEITLPNGGGTRVIGTGGAITLTGGEYGTFSVSGFRKWVGG